ncbi:hypothetical protein V8F33_006077 [Rhypophila sp. PSN 637]
MKLSLILLGLITAISASPAPLPVANPMPSSDITPDDIKITSLQVRSPEAVTDTQLSTREKVVSRTIYLSSTLNIRDDEPWPVNHRDYTRSHNLPPVIIGTKTGYTQKVSYKAEVGGEIRVEVYLTLTLRPSDLSVLVDYQVLLFEGTSTKTKDLDGKIEGSRRFYKDTDGHVKNTVHNTDEGGDRAALDLRVVNAK